MWRKRGKTDKRKRKKRKTCQRVERKAIQNGKREKETKEKAKQERQIEWELMKRATWYIAIEQEEWQWERKEKEARKEVEEGDKFKIFEEDWITEKEMERKEKTNWDTRANTTKQRNMEDKTL